jgi:hypothetical protein
MNHPQQDQLNAAHAAAQAARFDTDCLHMMLPLGDLMVRVDYEAAGVEAILTAVWINGAEVGVSEFSAGTIASWRNAIEAQLERMDSDARAQAGAGMFS